MGTCKMMVLAILAVLVVAAAAEPTDIQKQHDVNHLLHKIYGNLRDGDLKAAGEAFDPEADLSIYTDEGAAIQKLMKDVKAGKILEQKHYFSLFNTRHRVEALMLFDVFMHCKDWECARNNAAYFRHHMNEGEFIYAVYVAVIHSPLAEHIVLPPLYEITPHVTWHMEFPFWWEDKYGHHLDRKGENFFWVHHQLTVRFDAERLSNYLPPVEELHWNQPITHGFAPHTTYKYGGSFPSRPDNVKFEDVDGVARIRDLIIVESR